MAIKQRIKFKKYNQGGMRHNPHTDSGYSKATQSTKSATSGGGNQQTNTGSATKTGTGGNTQPNKRSFMPISLTLAKAFVIDPITKSVRQKKVKGENIFGKTLKGQQGFPINKEYYRQFNKPIDVMSPEGTQYMKDAGLIKPTPPGGAGDNDPRGLCPDGTFPPCKTPATQVKTPTTTNNSFLKGFQSYDDGGEVVISSNVDKDLL